MDVVHPIWTLEASFHHSLECMCCNFGLPKNDCVAILKHYTRSLVWWKVSEARINSRKPKFLEPTLIMMMRLNVSHINFNPR